MKSERNQTMESNQVNEDVSGPSSLSSDQASLCVIPDPDDSSEEDDFIHLDKNCLPLSITASDTDRAVIVFHSVEEEYQVESDVLCQYIRPKGWTEAPKDCVCLFKVGWVTIGECVAMVPVSETPCSNMLIGNVLFKANFLPRDSINFYQFCYLRDSILLGASTPFQFKLHTEEECLLGPNESKGNSMTQLVEENLAKQLHSRDLDLTRLQEKFTKLACSKDEQEKTMEGLEKQLDFQSVCIKKLVEEKAGLEAEKSHLSQEITELSALVEELKVKSSSSGNSSEDCLRSSNPLPVVENNSSLCGEKISESSGKNESTISYVSVGGFSYGDPQTVKISENHSDESSITKVSCDVELLQLKQRLSEVTEEKQFFQEQYGMASVALKKCTDELAALKEHVSELHTDHRTALGGLCDELKIMQDKLKEHEACHVLTEKHNTYVSAIKTQLHAAVSENEYLKEELDYLRNLIKKLEESGQKTGCKCEDSKKKIEEMEVRLSASELIKATLQAELDEELKLGEDRDRRLAQLEQAMLSNFKSGNEQAIAALEDGSVTSLFEMEQNVQSALEALEFALKEIETLRSRKAALSRANRALRDGIAKERSEWEEKMQVEREEFENRILDLSKQLESESSAKCTLQKEIQEQQEQCHLNLKRISELEHTDINAQHKEMEANTRSVLEALEAAQKEIDSLRGQRTSLYEQCSFLRQQLDEKKDTGLQDDTAQDHNCDLAGKLQEACDEYRKLYIEKKRIQEKLDRLQQKIKTKANSRGRQSTLPSNSQSPQMISSSSSTIPDDSECASCRSAAWRAMVEELM